MFGGTAAEVLQRVMCTWAGEIVATQGDVVLRLTG